MRQLAPDLMMTASVQIDFKKMPTTGRSGQKPIIQHGEFCFSLAGITNHETFILFLITQQVILEMALWLGWGRFNYSEIGFMEIATFHQFVHTA